MPSATEQPQIKNDMCTDQMLLRKLHQHNPCMHAYGRYCMLAIMSARLFRRLRITHILACNTPSEQKKIPINPLVQDCRTVYCQSVHFDDVVESTRRFQRLPPALRSFTGKLHGILTEKKHGHMAEVSSH